MCNNYKLPLTISTIAGAMAEGLSSEEIALLAAIFTQLGDTLTTIAATKACMSSGDILVE